MWRENAPQATDRSGDATGSKPQRYAKKHKETQINAETRTLRHANQHLHCATLRNWSCCDLEQPPGTDPEQLSVTLSGLCRVCVAPPSLVGTLSARRYFGKKNTHTHTHTCSPPHKMNNLRQTPVLGWLGFFHVSFLLLFHPFCLHFRVPI